MTWTTHTPAFDGDGPMTLSDRIAALSAPDRAMDAEIARALGMAHGSYTFTDQFDGSYYQYGERARKFTQSIDAALTLVPDGYQFHPIVQTDEGWTASIVGPKILHGSGATLAIAICVVALREKGL